jgi:hypothetical protein
MNASELLDVGSDDRCVDGRGVSRDQEVICSDRFSSVLQFRADSTVFRISGNIERQNLDLSEQVFDGFEQTF